MTSEVWERLLQYVAACPQGVDPAQVFAILGEGHEQDLGGQVLAGLLSQLNGDRTGRDATPDFVDRDDEARLTGTATERRRRQAIRRLVAEVEASREMLASLAAALGACPCFGHPECQVCRGEGRPGRYKPDPELFETLVEPAVIRRNGSPSSETHSTERGE